MSSTEDISEDDYWKKKKQKLAWFRNQVEMLASRIEAPEDLLPTYGSSRDFGYPHIEYWNEQFHFVVKERGKEHFRLSSSDPNEILFIVFEGIASEMAGNYEVRHRRLGEDPRRQSFDLRFQILEKLSIEWRERAKRRMDEVLAQHPFRDGDSRFLK